VGRARRDRAGTSFAVPPQRDPVRVRRRCLGIAEHVVEVAQESLEAFGTRLEHMFDRVEMGSDGKEMPAGRGILDRGAHAADPSEDQTSSFVRTRSTTAVVNSVVPLDPPRSGVFMPEATVSSTAS
jgi:hypothetical protein